MTKEEIARTVRSLADEIENSSTFTIGSNIMVLCKNPENVNEPYLIEVKTEKRGQNK